MLYEDWNGAEEFDMGNETATLDIDHLPVQDWCFDILLFYESIGDENSMQVLNQLMVYAQFSFVVNGVITCTLAIFGLIGNALLFYQVGSFETSIYHASTH
ncbi:unnamed protein product [Anisakis simplex]|uniref:Aa_trans domain-containing protein n=1 Tax=Anisakis simplex TaxID=6269 RepID=A0A0M3J2K5_ANISI|nr:unnamed protein product [Anisakis simplex]